MTIDGGYILFKIIREIIIRNELHHRFSDSFRNRTRRNNLENLIIHEWTRKKRVFKKKRKKKVPRILLRNITFLSFYFIFFFFYDLAGKDRCRIIYNYILASIEESHEIIHEGLRDLIFSRGRNHLLFSISFLLVLFKNSYINFTIRIIS